MKLQSALAAVVRVGDGRGFVIGERDRYIVTAAHCLPALPPAASIAYSADRTYSGLLAPLGESPAIWSECIFVDPIADIAVLSPVDRQELYDQAVAYDDLADATTPFRMGEPSGDCTAYALSLGNEWFPVNVWMHASGPLWLLDAAQPIEGAMSGSPIVAEDGSAVGVIACSGCGREVTHHENVPCPTLAHHLPGWLLRDAVA